MLTSGPMLEGGGDVLCVCCSGYDPACLAPEEGTEEEGSTTAFELLAKSPCRGGVEVDDGEAPVYVTNSVNL